MSCVHTTEPTSKGRETAGKRGACGYTQVECHGRNTVGSGLGLRVAAHMPTERQYRKNVSQFRTVPRASTMLTEGCGRYASSTEPLSKASSKTPR